MYKRISGVQADKKVSMIVRKTISVTVRQQQHRYSLYSIKTGIKEYVLAAVHLEDRRNSEFADRKASIQRLVGDVESTEDIYAIMKEQCEYLYKDTQGKIFAILGEIKLDGSLFAIARTMSNMFRGVSGLTGIQETVAEVSTKELIDANGMYFDKSYGFEICTEKYRFRLFELRMTPIYPIEIIVDEGICKNIGNALRRIAISTEKDNCFKIVDEEVFCEVLQKILQDQKVRYIISELQRRVPEEMKKEEGLPDKVILCEGRTDQVVLQAIAQKLECAITIASAEGKYNVPTVFDRVNVRNTKSRILIVVDSDGDEENTKKAILEKLGEEGYELAIINNSIEDWFAPNLAVLVN